MSFTFEQWLVKANGLHPDQTASPEDLHFFLVDLVFLMKGNHVAKAIRADSRVRPRRRACRTRQGKWATSSGMAI